MLQTEAQVKLWLNSNSLFDRDNKIFPKEGFLDKIKKSKIQSLESNSSECLR